MMQDASSLQCLDLSGNGVECSRGRRMAQFHIFVRPNASESSGIRNYLQTTAGMFDRIWTIHLSLVPCASGVRTIILWSSIVVN